MGLKWVESGFWGAKAGVNGSKPTFAPKNLIFFSLLVSRQRISLLFFPQKNKGKKIREVGENRSKPPFSPTLDPLRDIDENPFLTHFKGCEHCFPTRALRQP